MIGFIKVTHINPLKRFLYEALQMARNALNVFFLQLEQAEKVLLCPYSMKIQQQYKASACSRLGRQDGTGHVQV